MSSSCCSSDTAGSVRQSLNQNVGPVEAPVPILLAAVRRYGTPLYAYDVGRIRAQIAKLKANLPAPVQVLGHQTELDDEVSGEVLGFGLPALLPPQPVEGVLVRPHDDSGVGATNEGAAFS